jgi:protease I
MKNKKVAILVDDIYQDLEVWYPYLRLKEAGFTVYSVGYEKKTYKSKHGYEIRSDLAIAEALTMDFEAVIIPGGYAPDILRRYPQVLDFVKKLNDNKKIVAAICHGLWVAVSADILKGKKCTCFFAIKDDVINAGATYLDEEVVIDDNLISSRKPEDLPAFLKAVINKLS